MSPRDFEPELDQPTPRRIAAREGCGYGCALWGVRLFCLPHTLIGPWLVYQAIRAGVLYLGVLHAGIDIDGTITHKDERTGKKGPYYWADYVFTVNGVEYAAQTPLEADEYARLREGQTIPVRAWAAAPKDGHWPGVAGNDPLYSVRGLCFAALFWNAIISIIIWKFYLHPWRQRRLVRYGAPAPGRVLEVKTFQEKQGRGYKIYYTYPTGPSEALGGRQSGSVRVSHPKDASDVKVGDTLTVLYDPRRPRRSLLYRFSDYKAVQSPTV